MQDKIESWVTYKMRKDISQEAVSIDGKFIEDILPGFSTIKTSGREALTANVEASTIGRNSGEMLRYTRYPSRTITIDFVLEGSSLSNLREKLNQLNGILTAKEHEFIFNDEDDKLFVGVPTVQNEVDDFKNACGGKISIYCAYPFKRSVELKEVTATVGTGTTATFNFYYDGTYPVKPTLVAEFSGSSTSGSLSDEGDCGFVMFTDVDENIIQLGNPESVNESAVARASRINHEFSATTGWTNNGGSFLNYPIQGTSAIKTITDPLYKKGTGQTFKGVAPTGYGTDSYGWRGPSISKKLSSAASDWSVSLVHHFCVNSYDEFGSISCGLVNGDKLIAGFTIFASNFSTEGEVRYIINDRLESYESIYVGKYNEHFGYTKKSANSYSQPSLNSTIKKVGSTVTFKIGKLAEKSITVSGIENLKATDLVIYFQNFGGSNRKVVSTNIVHSINFTALPSNAKNFRDIPNVFTAGDIVEADCSNANVRIMRQGMTEGQLAPQYGALGNNWEEFELRPGQNVIGAAWSTWLTESTYFPKLKIRYREVFI